MIVLRTEEYENRYWCCREYVWAERSGMPIVVVDLRRKLRHPGSVLPFELAPSIRIQDGNLLRVLLHAVGAHLALLRSRWLLRNGKRPAEALPRHPSPVSLVGAIERLKSRSKSARATIVYPNPSMSEDQRRALDAMLSGSGVELASLDDWSVGR